MNAPLLRSLRVTFFNQLSSSVPLGQFVTTAENIRFSMVNFLFYHKAVVVFMYFSLSASFPTLDIRVDCEHLDWQVSSMTQILNVLSPLFSAVVDLNLDYRNQKLSSDQHNQADRTQWHELLGSFRNVQTLCVHDGLVGEVSRCLESDGEPASEILPEFKTLVCPIGSRDEKTIARFVHDREVAGLPIDLVEDVFPAGNFEYTFRTSAGVEYVDPASLPTPRGDGHGGSQCAGLTRYPGQDQISPLLYYSSHRPVLRRFLTSLRLFLRPSWTM